jgi:nicotinamide-nucleotide amidase
LSGDILVAGTDTEIDALVASVGQLLVARQAKLTTAESCTGGFLAKSLTDLPGSSAWFEYGFVVYGNEAKENMLGLDPELLERHGAVSREACEAMAMAAHVISGADISVAITGIAGPDGGSDDKPVGTVWLAWLGPRRRATCRMERFDGDRAEVRRQTVIAALKGILKHLADG